MSGRELSKIEYHKQITAELFDFLDTYKNREVSGIEAEITKLANKMYACQYLSDTIEFVLKEYCSTKYRVKHDNNILYDLELYRLIYLELIKKLLKVKSNGKGLQTTIVKSYIDKTIYSLINGTFLGKIFYKGNASIINYVEKLVNEEQHESLDKPVDDESEHKLIDRLEDQTSRSTDENNALYDDRYFDSFIKYSLDNGIKIEMVNYALCLNLSFCNLMKLRIENFEKTNDVIKDVKHSWIDTAYFKYFYDHYFFNSIYEDNKTPVLAEVIENKTLLEELDFKINGIKGDKSYEKIIKRCYNVINTGTENNESAGKTYKSFLNSLFSATGIKDIFYENGHRISMELLLVGLQKNIKKYLENKKNG